MSIERQRMKEFLVFFVHRHLDFRFPELDALLTMQSLNPQDCYTRELNPLSSPLARVKLPSEEHAKFLSQRGILVKGVYEVWGEGSTYEEVVEAVDSFNGKDVFLSDTSLSWKIQVDAFGLKLSMEEQIAKREKFRDILPFAGPVQMKNPALTFLILEDIGVDQTKTIPESIFFLRALAGGEKNRGRGGARDLVDMQTLKRRAYIGPTSMDAEMALIMCNMALVQTGDLVIDPFVGTGSVLVPCTTFGGICMGTDIDSRVLHGKNDKTIESNFHQYNLRVPDLVRADNSRSPLRCGNYFDAVVCDPPYGIRAGARKSGRREAPPDQSSPATTTAKPKYGPRIIPDEWIDSHIPATQPYAAEDVMNDLLVFAANNLRIGGRVVYLLPTTYDYTDDDLPVHPSLRVIANSEEKLTSKYARRLITMEKIECAASNAVATKPFKSDFSFAKLRDKIIDSNKKSKRNES